MSRLGFRSSSTGNSHEQTSNISDTSRETSTANAESQNTYLARLWPWAERANKSKLSKITLSHIMSGDTVSPISFSDFEAFLAFSDISLENLHFVIWFRDYQSRYKAAAEKQKVSSTDNIKDVRLGPLKEFQATTIGAVISHGSPALSTSTDPTIVYRKEVDNVLATFFVPNARKELLLSAELRDQVVIAAKKSTDPESFFAAYKIVYESLESVSLPRFLAYAATNINRPRQLFWYFSALPTFLLGVAIALIIIMSSSPRLIVPPQSHRAWRLFSVPCFMLSSVMWYKGYRGFCPLLWLRSSTQLRVWELEVMSDDEEAQTYVSRIDKPRDLTSTSHSSSSFINSTRIAPFLDFDEPVPKSPASSDSSSDDGVDVEDQRRRQVSSGLNAQFRSRRSRFNRPPIFGPDRVVEDAQIRAVHRSLLFSLIRFGLFWAVISGAIVVSVPSWHVN